MPDLTPQEARISELLRLRVVVSAGDDVLAYIDERLEQRYPDEYKAYRRHCLKTSGLAACTTSSWIGACCIEAKIGDRWR